MKRHLLVDVANNFFKARYVGMVRSAGSPEERAGLCLSIFLQSLKRSWQLFNADHVVFAFEGHSWRHGFYAPYKKNRVFDHGNNASSEEVAEESIAFDTAFEGLVNYLKKNTECTILHHQSLEADDLIAAWVQQNPDVRHYILSSDSDFQQLLSSNVSIWNSIANHHMTIDGVFDENGEVVLDKKGQAMTVEAPEYILFKKCIRGDSSDNIRTAYLKVREHGTKNKVGIRECYDDRNTKGFAWQNFMYQKWEDPMSRQWRTVIEDYERNRILIDLSAQPEPIRKAMAEAVENAKVERPKVEDLGINFIRYCNEWDLNMVRTHVTAFSELFGGRLKSISE